MTTAQEVFQDLYVRSQDLEQFAASIQGDREPGLSAEQIDVFVENYQTWFAEAMAALPADLQDRFRKEYEGGGLNRKIKAFLQAPIEISPLHRGPRPVENADVFPYWNNAFDTTFRGPLLAQRQILLEAAKREPKASPGSTVQLLEQVCRRLPLVADPLASRRKGKAAFVLEDEYDVQDLLHGVLRLLFEDVRPEEPMGSRAGASARVDFLLKNERVLVEAKFVRAGHGAREIGEELIIDIERYRAHPDCDVLVALVYDPEKRIENPRGLEGDLSGEREGLVVAVYVVA
jgi:hypothetical protein